ncbi:glycogen synthase kinase 3 [Anopheles sinensis]|uniref:Glycogen synthase kinase 3 n=1 Tax=Anopheles sinensis TaxID=74873 RepID=A0A084VKQ9_ANOSI|nr:glycogen synthase kinase 3 [Anopheles sinensis]
MISLVSLPQFSPSARQTRPGVATTPGEARADGRQIDGGHDFPDIFGGDLWQWSRICGMRPDRYRWSLVHGGFGSAQRFLMELDEIYGMG